MPMPEADCYCTLLIVPSEPAEHALIVSNKWRTCRAYRDKRAHLGLGRGHAHARGRAHHGRPLRLTTNAPPALCRRHPGHPFQVQAVLLHVRYVHECMHQIVGWKLLI